VGKEFNLHFKVLSFLKYQKQSEYSLLGLSLEILFRDGKRKPKENHSGYRFNQPFYFFAFLSGSYFTRIICLGDRKPFGLLF